MQTVITGGFNVLTKNYGPLTGVQILDISTMIAAPFGATLLADLGGGK